jgi:hypothetical protein
MDMSRLILAEGLKKAGVLGGHLLDKARVGTSNLVIPSRVSTISLCCGTTITKFYLNMAMN